MPSNDSTSARAPKHVCRDPNFGRNLHDSCDACGIENGITIPGRAPATPPSDETPGDPLICAKCGKRKMQWINYPERAPRCINDACNAPLVDTGGPTAGNGLDEWQEIGIEDSAPRWHIVETPFCCPACNGAGRVSRPPHIAGDATTWTAAGSETYPCSACNGCGVLWRRTPPSPEGTGTPPTPSELPSRTELGVGGAGELPGVSEYEGAQALTSVFAFAKRECYSDEEEIVDVAERYVAGLRLRAEAAERQLADITALMVEPHFQGSPLRGSFAPDMRVVMVSTDWYIRLKAATGSSSLVADRLTATLSSQRTL